MNVTGVVACFTTKEPLNSAEEIIKNSFRNAVTDPEKYKSIQFTIAVFLEPQNETCDNILGVKLRSPSKIISPELCGNTITAEEANKFKKLVVQVNLRMPLDKSEGAYDCIITLNEKECYNAQLINIKYEKSSEPQAVCS